jgi:uncharacterized protein
VNQGVGEHTHSWAFPRHGTLWPAVFAAIPVGELAHDQHHILRVYTWSLQLAAEAAANADLAGAAALVHDLVYIPKDDAERSRAGERSAREAMSVLAAAGYDALESAVVAEAVRTCSWSRGLAPTAAEGRVLQDADRLDAIGAHGLMRTIACSQWMSKTAGESAFYHPSQPFPSTGGRALDDRHFPIDHCYAKLLKLSGSMHLPSAQAEARQRHAFLLAFLAQLQLELSPR